MVPNKSIVGNTAYIHHLNSFSLLFLQNKYFEIFPIAASDLVFSSEEEDVELLYKCRKSVVAMEKNLHS